ncbi:hypothetical protein ACEQ8H_000369 [Pleosporales sp. CAS-2024a]
MPYHNNQLTMVGLDSMPQDTFYAPPRQKRKRTMTYGQTMPSPHPSFCHVDSHNPLSDAELHAINASNTWADWDSDSTAVMMSNSNMPLDGYSGNGITKPDFADQNGADNGRDGMGTNEAVFAAPASAARQDPRGYLSTTVKTDEEIAQVSLTPFGGSDYDDSDYDARRPSKVPKKNKDGFPRKPRQPRPKLLKWDDNDWKNVALGLVWACGDNGIQIPFDQASQVVSESCTAGALQQALLKLRAKQIAEGFQIPLLRMAWTRKNKNGAPSMSNADPIPPQGTVKNTLPKKKPTRVAGAQSLVITLRRAYKDSDREHLAYPYTGLGYDVHTVAFLNLQGNSTQQRRSGVMRRSRTVHQQVPDHDQQQASWMADHEFLQPNMLPAAVQAPGDMALPSIAAPIPNPASVSPGPPQSDYVSQTHPAPFAGMYSSPIYVPYTPLETQFDTWQGGTDNGDNHAMTAGNSLGDDSTPPAPFAAGNSLGEDTKPPVSSDVGSSNNDHDTSWIDSFRFMHEMAFGLDFSGSSD